MNAHSVELVSFPALVARTILAAMLTGTSCAHAPPAPAPAAPAATAARTDPPPPAAAVPPPGRCQSDTECTEGQLCIRNGCVDISLGLSECQQFRVRFGFNAVDFAPESKDDLTRIARCLRAAQGMTLLIEGNADERGTEEYNLQLGAKRASTIEKYLLALGVTDGQLKTVSYGENRPLCTERDEACWARNRQAAVVPAKGKGAK